VAPEDRPGASTASEGTDRGVAAAPP
jgi:hypothetical protein